MNNALGLPVGQGALGKAASRDTSADVSGARGSRSGESPGEKHEFATVLGRTSLDRAGLNRGGVDRSSRDQTRYEQAKYEQAKYDQAKYEQARHDQSEATSTEARARAAQKSAPDSSKADCSKSVDDRAEQKDSEAADEDESQHDNDVLSDAAAELLMLMNSAPVVPAETSSADAAAVVGGAADELSGITGLQGNSAALTAASTGQSAMPDVTATWLQSNTGSLPPGMNNMAQQNEVASLQQLDAQQSTLNEPSLPAWLMKSMTETSEGAPDRQMLQELGQVMSRLADRPSGQSADVRERGLLSTDLNLTAALTTLGSASGTQSAQDLTADALNGNVLRSPVGSAAWTAELGNKLVIMSKHETPIATLHVTPDDLGPVQVRIETQNNQANVWFTADHPDTRSAIEQSLPRLREMFAAQGLMLNDAGVFNDRSGQQSAYQPHSSSSRWWQGSATAETDEIDTVTVRTLSLNVVDTYA